MTGSLELARSSVYRPLYRVGGANRSRSSYERTNERTNERLTDVAMNPLRLVTRAGGQGNLHNSLEPIGARFAAPARCRPVDDILADHTTQETR